MASKVKAADGVLKTITKEGKADAPIVKVGDECTMHATGILTKSGKKFWSTKDKGQKPFACKMGVGQLIPGWDQGVLGMKLGEHATFYLEGRVAYGAAGFPAWGIGKNADLTFEIELLEIKGSGKK